MDELPDDLVLVVLAWLDFRDAWHAGLTCRRMLVLLERAAPEVADGWARVPALLAGESALQRLAFVYAQRRQAAQQKSPRVLHGTFWGQNVQGCNAGVLQVAVSESNTALVLDAAGAVWSLGADGSARLRATGLSACCVFVAAGYRCSAALDSAGALWTWWGGDSMTMPPRELRVPEPVAHVAVGPNHMLVVSRAGLAYGCGSNASGQLGLGPGAGVDAPVLDMTRLPLPEAAAAPQSRVLQAAAGAEHSLLLLSTGRLLGAGTAYSGELLGRTGSSPAFEPVHDAVSFTAVHAARMSTALICRQGGLYVCGYNSWGHFWDPLRVACAERVVSCHLTPHHGVTFVCASGKYYAFQKATPVQGVGVAAAVATSSKIFTMCV